MPDRRMLARRRECPTGGTAHPMVGPGPRASLSPRAAARRRGTAPRSGSAALFPELFAAPWGSPASPPPPRRARGTRTPRRSGGPAGRRFAGRRGAGYNGAFLDHGKESLVPTVRETVAEMVQYVFPQYAGAPGQIYGGRMMDWIATAGTLAASRVARGPVLVGAMDELDFLHPVRVGEIAILRARVEYVGRTSLEVGVRVYAESPATGERWVTLSSHLAFVALDPDGHPRPVGIRIAPADAAEAAVVQAAEARRQARRARLTARAERARDVADHTAGFQWRLEQQRFVFPEDALHGTLMFAGRLLLTIDEVAAIVAVRYARAPLATASVDALEFCAPIRVG